MKLRSRLVYRLYAIGVVQLLLVALTTFGIAYAIAKSPPRWDMQAIVSQLTPLLSDPPALKRELEKLRKRHDLLLSVYDDDRHLLGTNVEPPLHPPRFAPPPPPPNGVPGTPGPLPDPSMLPPLPALPNGHFVAPPPPPPFGGPAGFGGPFPKRTALHLPPPHTYASITFQGKEGVVVARFEHPRPSYWLPALTLTAGLFVVGAGALLTARWIAQPLQGLSRASVALGQGDLTARTGLSRSDEIGEVARAFDNMADRIQALRLAEKELLANVAHELRTPLSRIRVALEIAGEGDAHAVKSSLGEIAVDLGELEALVDDVLNATRFELADGKPNSPGLAVRLQSVSPRDIAERAAERFRSQHGARPFSTRFSDDAPPIDADPVLLRRVLDNLLENADKYSPRASAPIELALTSSAKEVEFAVQDAGAGIAEADLPHVFDAFFRGERSRSRGTGGVGLGLTLAKRIVEAHGGTLAVTSTLGVGTRVTARVPLSGATPISSKQFATPPS
ncbi:MAG: HAMP domain-containing sensor histidine kinase [Polyangiaceae bacterium]